MLKNKDNEHDATRDHSGRDQVPRDPNTQAAQAPQSPTTQDQSGGELKVGDVVQVEAQVAAITGEYLTLRVTRAAGNTDKDNAPRYDDGTTITLSAKQVRKA